MRRHVKANPALKLIVVDPRRTDTAAEAICICRFCRAPMSRCFTPCLNVMLWEELIDRDYIAAHTGRLGRAARNRARILPEKSRRFAASPLRHRAGRALVRPRADAVAVLPGPQSVDCGTDKNASLINLHLASGQSASRARRRCPSPRQPNAMGGREVGVGNLLSRTVT